MSGTGRAAALELDLLLAEKVYRSLLPPRLTIPGLDVVTHVHPHYRIGGDYATVFPTGDGRVFLCVSDVTAHGIAPALLVSRVNSFVLRVVLRAHHPCEVVQELNAFFGEHFAGLGMYLSFFCATVDLGRMEFAYAGCGHPPALHLRASSPGQATALASQHSLVGLFPELSNECRIDKVALESGDRILLYTDGVTEARNADGEFWGVEGLSRTASACVAENLEGDEFAERILASANDFQGGISQDDALLMVATFN